MKKINLNLNPNEIRNRIELDKDQYGSSEWAQKLGVSPNVVSNIHGKSKNHDPSLQYVVAVARFTGKPIEWYLYGQGSQESAKCPTCGNWSDEVRDACRKLQEIMEFGDDVAKETILNNLDLIRRGMTKRAGHKAKKDLPGMQPDTELPRRKRKQTAAR